MTPMLACGSMHFTTGDLILIYSILGLWLAGAILSLINFALIFVSGIPPFMAAHFCVLLVYVFAAYLLFTGGFGDASGWTIWIPIYAIPLSAIVHFGYLLWARARFKMKADKPNA